MKLVLGIAPPRSGTAWLCNFLTWGGSHFMHEAMFGVESLQELHAKLMNIDLYWSEGEPVIGTIDTAAAFIAPALYDYFPDAKYLLVVRPREDVKYSQEQIGITPDLGVVYEGLHWAYEHIPEDQLMVVEYRTMFTQGPMREVWEFIEHPDPFPFERMELLRGFFVEDGFKTGFGRFVDQEIVQRNLAKFSMLQESCVPNVSYLGMNRPMVTSIQ